MNFVTSTFVKLCICSSLIFWREALCQDTICFRYLPCLSQKDPWVSAMRPFPLPEDPITINVSATFFSRKQPDGVAVQLYPDIVFKNVPGYSIKRTVTITHGFASSSSSQWVHDMKDKYLANMDANVFLINWENGANKMLYTQAAANTRVVGEILGRFGNYLRANTRNRLTNFHMIGHSLGAHITGYAAKFMNKKAGGKVFRITGLDPAQPGFQNLSSEVRLSKDDGKFVDIVHSDAKPFVPLFGFGYLTNMGHVDFYLNQGFEQPGCNDGKPVMNITSIDQIKDITVEVISNAVACSHGRSYVIFTASIDPDVKCEFIGHRVITEILITSDQSTCGEGGKDCTKMGLNTQDSPVRGAFQVMTSGVKPYCCYNYSPVTGCSATNTTGGGVVVTTPAIG